MHEQALVFHQHVIGNAGVEKIKQVHDRWRVAGSLKINLSNKIVTFNLPFWKNQGEKLTKMCFIGFPWLSYLKSILLVQESPWLMTLNSFGSEIHVAAPLSKNTSANLSSFSEYFESTSCHFETSSESCFTEALKNSIISDDWLDLNVLLSRYTSFRRGSWRYQKFFRIAILWCKLYVPFHRQQRNWREILPDSEWPTNND